MSEKNIVRTRYDRVRVSKDCPGGRVKSEFKDDTNVNNIISRFKTTGVLPQMRGNPIYGDFSEAVDFQAAFDLVATAEAQFSGLSADLRKRFNNDPREFLEFCGKADKKEMAKLGLLSEEATKAALEEKPAEPPAKKAKPKPPLKEGADT